MRSSVAPTRAPRPPPPPPRSDPNSAVAARGASVDAGGGGGRAGPAAAAAAGAAAVASGSETQLRRRLAQTEMRLRDMDEDAARVRALQEQELANLERDNVKLREQLEVIRMGECMSPAEARALQVHMSYQRAATGAPAGRAESKLIGSTTLKYQTARAEVHDRRRDCVLAERQLAEARARLTQLRHGRHDVKRRSRATELTAAVRVAAADTYRAMMHERLRGLEEQVAREQERFSSMVAEAKQVRLETDALLINQTSNEKMYRRRYDALLAKRREMGYLLEVCNLLCEERQHVVAELAGLQRGMADESRQYESAFDELTGVLEENIKAQAASREQLDELRRLAAQTRAEREALEVDNGHAKAAIERRRRRTASRRLGDGAAASEANRSRSVVEDAAEEEEDAVAVVVGTTASHGGTEVRTPESGVSLDAAQQHVRTYDEYFHKLSGIVQSDAIEDVVGFLDVAADERYRVFDEMNAIKRDMAALEAERAALVAQLSGGGGVGGATTDAAAAATAAAAAAAAGEPPADGAEAAPRPLTVTSTSSALAALAGANTLDALAAVSAAVAAAKAGTGAIGASGAVAATGGATERSARMAQLLHTLGTTRDLVYEEEEEQEASAVVLEQVVAQVSEVFCGLGCSADELRATTGLTAVQESTLLACLAMIEQRTCEHLLAYARQQQHRLQQQQMHLQVSGAWTEAHASAAAVTRHAARPLLRRPDLLPRAKKNAVAAALTRVTLPRSTDMSTITTTTTAPSLEELADERPLSMAELKRVVETKRAVARS
ncbi:hypothetical protein NESM_000205800 [Novymonas esmeraldas]|uniref:Uncharacterized protein n=1 Tax=Novymonas esmeraldas TaxID=1808958 RepID=A0AAW0F7X1_9TRYP